MTIFGYFSSHGNLIKENRKTLYSYEEAVFDAIMTLVEAIMKECVLIKEIEREEKEEEVSKSG